MIEMRHPNIEGTATATRDAFRRVWAPRGWQEVSPEESVALRASGGEALQLSDVNKDALATFAARSGVDVDPSARKDKIVAALRKEFGIPAEQSASSGQSAQSTEQGGS